VTEPADPARASPDHPKPGRGAGAGDIAGRIAQARAALTAMGFLPDAQLDLAEAALMLAVPDAPDRDLGHARAHLAQLVAEGRAMAAQDTAAREGDLAARAALLAALLHHRHGYRGDAERYDDLANANLLRCISRRKGLPVMLGVIWLHVARALDWDAHGLDVPAHFLVGLYRGNGLLPVDVFAGGAALDPPGVRALLKRVAGEQAELKPDTLRRMDNRGVLARLMNNIKLRRLRAGELAGALAAVEDTLRFAPQQAYLWREAGLINARLEKLGAAISCLTRFADLVSDPEARRRAETLLAELRGRLN